MDINDLRALSTVLIFLAFVAICYLVFRRNRKDYYEEASMLPFSEESGESELSVRNQSKEGESK